MSTEEILCLVVSALGGSTFGGTLVAIVNWILTSKSERRKREIDFLRSQLMNLYGPLYFLTSSNQRLFDMNAKFHDAYKKEYIEKTYSDQYNARERAHAEATKTLDIANEYVEQVRANNERILELLTSAFYLIDLSDIDVFNQFVLVLQRDFSSIILSIRRRKEKYDRQRS